MSTNFVRIPQFNKGFDTYDQPEILPDDGFPILEDAICYRGVLKRRDGFLLLGTIPQISITSISTANPGVISTAPVNHNLSDNQQIFITGVTGTGIDNFNSPSFQIPFLVTVLTPTTFTIGVSGVGSVYASDGTIIVPVMSLDSRLSATFFEDLIAFTENQAYLFTSGAFANISGGTLWTGDDTDFFDSINYFGSFWVTNDFDPIRYYISGTTWTDFIPVIDASANTLENALLLFSYRNRLVALNTTEGGFSRAQRARWSQNGTPYVGAPTPGGASSDVNAWRQDIAGKGGFIDAPTSEKIVTAGFVRDTLVVMFENSAWRLSYTGNEILPFIWERINTQLGAESPWSGVLFDEGLLSVGRRGITATDTNSCKRIEAEIIPQQIFQMDTENNNNLRIQGQRDYQRLLVYWTYVNAQEENVVRYPNKVLVYNYSNNNWGVFNQTFTCYGQYREISDITWQEDLNQWQFEVRQWNSGNLQSGDVQIVAGDQIGNVYILTPDITADNGEPYGMNIWTKKFNPFIDQGVQCKAIYMHYLVSGTAAGQFTLNHYIDENSDTPIETIICPTSTTTGQEKVWRRIILSGTSQYHQFQLTFSQDQLADDKIPLEDYEFSQFIFEFAPSGRLNYGDLN